MAWFWEKEEPKYDSHEYQYANNPQYREYYDNLQIIKSDGSQGNFATDSVINAGDSVSNKIKSWADKMYENEDKVIDTITETAKKVANTGANIALLAVAGISLLIYIKYFHKKG